MMWKKFTCMLVASFGLLCASRATADTLWTDWTSATTGTSAGTASGALGGVSVSYLGELPGFVINGTTSVWAPNSSFTGGTVTASPSTVGDELSLVGNFAGPNTITFGSPVVDPLIAIWSLGNPGAPATFTFSATPTFEAGGPNSLYGGSSITVAGNVVTGREGNGVVQFTGTYSSISWTDTPEVFYAFTVGMNGAPTIPDVPEPSSVALLGLVLMGIAPGLWRSLRTSK